MREAKVARLFCEAKELLDLFGLEVIIRETGFADEHQYEVVTSTCSRTFGTTAELWSFAYGVSEGAGIERDKK